MADPQPEDVDLLAAALRADAADLDVYARVLTESLSEALPAEMMKVDRDRSLADRLNGRPGRVAALKIDTGDWELGLDLRNPSRPVANVRQKVRGVAISSKEVGIDEWTQQLAKVLAARARESTAARQALGRLLGQG